MKITKPNVPNYSDRQKKAFEYLVQESQNEKLKKLWAEELKNLPKDPVQTQNIPKIKRLVWRVLTLAAVFFMVLSAYFLMESTQDSLPKLANEMMSEMNIIPPDNMSTRGGVDINEDLLFEEMELDKSILEGLRHKEYRLVAENYSMKEEKFGLTTGDEFYYAFALASMKKRNNKKAIALLENIISNEKDFYQESLWVSALIYLKMDEPMKAKTNLTTLKSKFKYQQNKAELLLDKINK